MHSTNTTQPTDTPTARSQQLAVVDWSLDPHDVAAALREHAHGRPIRFGLLVPARLHGLQWIGDPTASRPCAERQLRELGRLLRQSGIDVAAERIGDPERVPAIDEALSDWTADEIVLVDRRTPRRGPWLFGLVKRIARRSGLPVRSIAVDAASRTNGNSPWAREAHRCIPTSARAA